MLFTIPEVTTSTPASEARSGVKGHPLVNGPQLASEDGLALKPRAETLASRLVNGEAKGPKGYASSRRNVREDVNVGGWSACNSLAHSPS